MDKTHVEKLSSKPPTQIRQPLNDKTASEFFARANILIEHEIKAHTDALANRKTVDPNSIRF